MNPKQGSRRKLLKVAALGASAVAAVGCGSSSAGSHPIVGTAVSDGGLGREAQDAGSSMLDGGVMGKVAEDAGPIGVAPGEAGTDSGTDSDIVVGTAPNDAGEG
jgi:hypothetical protein